MSPTTSVLADKLVVMNGQVDRIEPAGGESHLHVSVDRLPHILTLVQQAGRRSAKPSGST
jgi:hypothetical protein